GVSQARLSTAFQSLHSLHSAQNDTRGGRFIYFTVSYARSWIGPAFCVFNFLRTSRPSIFSGLVRPSLASAAATAAASPRAMAVTVTRVELCVRRVVEWQRPATIK